MDSQKRLLIALALSFVLTALYMFLNPAPPPPDLLDGGVATADGGVTPRTDVERPPQAVVAPDGDGGVAQAPTGEPPPEVKTVAVPEDRVRYLLTTLGAGIASAELQGEKMREQRPLSIGQGYKLLFGGEVPDAPQMDMGVPPQGFPPSLTAGVLNSPTPFDPWTVWRLDEAASSENRKVFTAQNGIWRARKILEWPQAKQPLKPATHGFEIAMTVELTNTSAQAAQGDLAVHYSRAVNPLTEEKASLLGGVGNESKASCFVGEDLFQVVPEQEMPSREELTGPVHFIGVDQAYFLGAIFPVQQARQGRCELHATPTGRAAVGHFPITVQAGQTHTEQFGVFVGPKDGDYLSAEPTPEIAAALGVQRTDFNARLVSTVNFGIWEVICVVLLAILKFFYGVFANWGVAIIFLTITVKIVLLPLTYKSMVSAENMKKLQPKVEAIRKKFEGDRERMNMEMMKVYQEAKVNPLGGCFPLLLQMPVWIALFTALRNSYEIYREPFFGPVWTDLTYKDPTYIFPVLLGVTMIATQKLQPTTMMDPMQQKIMTWFMPIFFSLLMLAYPAGLTLYIFTNNVLSIFQQYGIRKWLERKGGSGGTPATVPAKKGAK